MLVNKSIDARKPGRSKSHTTFNVKLCPVHAMIVARSASHIASTLSPQQRINAMAEALAEVAKDFGDDAIDSFLIALKSWFVQREYGAAIELVGYFQEHGRLPEVRQPSVSSRRGSRVRSNANDNASLRAT